MKLPKFLRLPTPIELGKSTTSSLQCEDFGAEPGAYTWDQYEREMKKEYPFRFLINDTIPHYFRVKISMPLIEFKYWIVSHTIRKYHLLDLRNNNYKYGWIDADTQLLFATMKILDNFIIEQNTEKRLAEAREELKNDPEQKQFNWSDVIKSYEELLEIQRWWREEYPKIEDYFDNSDHIYDKATEMIKRVADLRGGMWT